MNKSDNGNNNSNGKIVPFPEPKVKIIDGAPMVTSFEVALRFDKDHCHVLEAIKKLECSQEFRQSNFRLSSYVTKQGKSAPMCLITEEGFYFLAMGFTGVKAAHWKEMFILAFQEAKKALKDSNRGVSGAIMKIAKTQEQLVSIYSQNTEILHAMNNRVQVGFRVVDGRLCILEDGQEQLVNDVSEIKEEQSKRRKKPKKAYVNNYKEFICEELEGLCPCCLEELILDHNGNLVSDENGKIPEPDHQKGRHKREIDDCWFICWKCNHGKSGMTTEEREKQFDSFHVRRKRFYKRGGTMFYRVNENIKKERKV